jgi:hypothetical protein
MNHNAATVLSAGTLLALCGSLFAQEQGDRIPLIGAIPQLEQLELPGAVPHDLIEIDLPEGLPLAFNAEIRIDGINHTLELSKHSMRAGDFTILVDDGLQLNRITPPPSATYKGTVEGREGTVVRGSLLEDGLHVMVDLGEQGGTWFVQPLASLSEDALSLPDDWNEATHVVLTDQFELPEGFVCGNDLYDLGEPVETQDNGDGSLAGATLYLVEVGSDTDFEFFVKNGSSVTNTVNDVELIWALTENVYERDVAIVFELSTIVVRANVNDPWSDSTDSSVILNAFRNRWNSTSNDEYRIKRDVGHIFTGKNIANSVLGLATVGVVCNQSFAYAMVESRWTSILTGRAVVTAHELGHNFNASHCDTTSSCSGSCRIMCSGVGGCNSVTGSNFKFEGCAQDFIINYRNAVSCDTIFTELLPLPFSDDFESGSFPSSSIWSFNKGGVHSTGGVNEPSGIRALNLDSINDGEYSSDEIRTTTFSASGFGPMWLSFYSQHRSVEAGEKLIVEYEAGGNDWIVIDEIISDGTSQSQFVFHEYLLDDNAQSNRFRLRFRTVGDELNDDWYIDNVEIDGSPEEPAVDPPSNDDCVDAIIISDGATTFTTLGSTDSDPGISASCDEGNGFDMRKDVWFRYTTSCGQLMTVTTCGSSDLDTRIAIYDAGQGCPFGESSLVACSDDSTECGDDAFVQVRSDETALLLIRVGTQSGESAEDQLLVVTCTPYPIECPGDFDDSGVIDGADLSYLLAAWGGPNGDLTNDGTTDGQDLSVILAGWGICLN